MRQAPDVYVQNLRAGPSSHPGGVHKDDMANARTLHWYRPQVTRRKISTALHSVQAVVGAFEAFAGARRSSQFWLIALGWTGRGISFSYIVYA